MVCHFKLAFLKTKYFAVIALVVASNVIVLTTASIMFQSNNQAFGISILAYLFGLKHAVDADHIAAIDNVTRLLVSKGQKPCTGNLQHIHLKCLSSIRQLYINCY